MILYDISYVLSYFFSIYFNAGHYYPFSQLLVENNRSRSAPFNTGNETIVDRMSVSSPNSYVEIPTPSRMTVLGGGPRVR